MSFTAIMSIIAAAVFLVLIILVLWFWKAKDDAQASLIAAQTVHTADVTTHTDDLATIAKITAFRTADDALLVKYDDDLRAMDARFNSIDGSIANLRLTDAKVRDYLATPIPASLLAVLNSVPDAASTTAPAK